MVEIMIPPDSNAFYMATINKLMWERNRVTQNNEME